MLSYPSSPRLGSALNVPMCVYVTLPSPQARLLRGHADFLHSRDAPFLLLPDMNSTSTGSLREDSGVLHL